MAETYIKEQEDAELAAQVERTPPDEAWQPMTQDELMARLEAATAAYKKEGVKDAEDVEKESWQW